MPYFPRASPRAGEPDLGYGIEGVAAVPQMDAAPVQRARAEGVCVAPVLEPSTPRRVVRMQAATKIPQAAAASIHCEHLVWLRAQTRPQARSSGGAATASPSDWTGPWDLDT